MEDNDPKGEDIALIGASPATWQSQATESAPTRLPSRALVVDDSLVVAEVVTTLLRRTGWTVDVATSVDAALEHVRGVPYDLVVCDVCMPDGGGPAVYYAATTRRPDLTNRFLFITGNVDDADVNLRPSRRESPAMRPRQDAEQSCLARLRQPHNPDLQHACSSGSPNLEMRAI